MKVSNHSQKKSSNSHFQVLIYKIKNIVLLCWHPNSYKLNKIKKLQMKQKNHLKNNSKLSIFWTLLTSKYETYILNYVKHVNHTYITRKIPWALMVQKDKSLCK